MSRVAVALCTYERPQPLADALADVLLQAPADAEVVVVDQSVDARAANERCVAVHADSRVRYLHRPAPGLPAARNAAIAETIAPIIIFFDDDVRLHPGCIAAHAAAYADPATVGVVGRIVERRLRPNTGRTRNEIDAWGRVRYRLDGSTRVRVASLKGANMSVRRDAVARIGGFDENYAGTAYLEEADLSERLLAAGGALWFEPAAGVDHLAAPAGGVRQSHAETTERWRFHNTGYFLAKHRAGSVRRARLAFLAIAVRRAAAWRDAGAVLRLIVAFDAGVRRGRSVR